MPDGRAGAVFCSNDHSTGARSYFRVVYAVSMATRRSGRGSESSQADTVRPASVRSSRFDSNVSDSALAVCCLSNPDLFLREF